MTETPELINLSQLVLHPDTIITSNTTLYVRLIAHGCSSSLAAVNIQIAPRNAPAVVTPVTQCLGTRALITIHNTVKGYRYRIYDAASGGNLLRDIISLQSGDMIISIPQAVIWEPGTIFYVQEAVRDEDDTYDICLSPFAEVTMENGTPVAPSFAVNVVYTCSSSTAILTIKNALSNHTYNIYDSENGSNVVATITPNAYVNQLSFNVDLPPDFNGSVTYWMDIVENGTICYSLRTPITITLAIPEIPILENPVLTVCRNSIPVITVTNTQKDVEYIVTDGHGDTIAGPITASDNQNLSIPLFGLNLSYQQPATFYIKAQTSSIKNNCQSGQNSFILIDGEPILPIMPDMAICSGEQITINIPNPVAGYTYLVYDATNHLLGFTDIFGNLILPAPGIPNPINHTDLNYYVKVQSPNCISQSNESFIVRINHTIEAEIDFTVSSATVCELSDAALKVKILSPAIISSGATVKWYNNSNLTELMDTQIIPPGTDSIVKILSDLSAGTYIYYVTVENTLAGLCQSLPEQAAVVRVIVKPRAISSDILALDAVICSDDQIILNVQSDNPDIINPVYNWYNDPNHTILVAANTPSYTPFPNLTTSTDYYVTVQNDDYCENIPGNDEWVHVEVSLDVASPFVSVSGDTVVCSGNDLVLQVTSTGSVSGYELWENGLPLPDTNYTVDLNASTITVFSPSSGSHTYTVVSELYTNGIICLSDETSSISTINIAVNNSIPAPNITLESSGICFGDTTVFHITYAGTQPSGYKLMNGTDEINPLLYTVSSDMKTIHLLQSAPGTHSYTLISLITENGITCESQPSESVHCEIYLLPSVTITNSETEIRCAGAQTPFNLQFTGTPPFTYSIQEIDTDNNISYLAQNATTTSTSITLTPVTSGKTTYTVSALNDNHCAALPNDLPSVIIDVFPELQPGALIPDVTICNNTDPGDLNVSSAFDGDTSNYQYSWQQDLGSGFTDIGINTASYDPGILITGTYRFQRTITDGCQIKTVQATIMVNSDLQSGSLIPDTGICNNTSPGELSLTLPTGGNTDQYTYTWRRFDSSSPSTGTIVSLSPNYNPGTLSTGTYRYQRIVRDGCQTDTNEVTITVFNDLQPGSLASSISLCLLSLPGELSVTLPSGGDTSNYGYSWQYWNGSAFVDLSPAVTTALYTPLSLPLLNNIFQRTVTDGCQTVTASVEIKLFSDLNPGELIGDTTIYNGTSPGNLNRKNASLCSGGALGITYEWFKESSPGNWVSLGVYTANYTPPNLTTGIHHYRRSSSYLLLFTETVDVVITVLSDLDGGMLIADTSICNGTSPGNLNKVSPTGGNTAQYTYEWQEFNGTSFVTIVPAVNSENYDPGALSSGVYRYRRIVSDGHQSDTVETTITVFANLTAGSLKDTTICNGMSPGDLSLLLPTGGDTSNYTYSWQMWDGNALTDISPAVTTSGYVPGNFTQTGSYLFQRTVSDGYQTQTAQATIIVKPNPEAYISADSDVCEDQTFPLVFSFTGTSPWTITFIYGNDNTQVIHTFHTPPYQYMVSPQETTTYTIKKVVDGNECTANY